MTVKELIEELCRMPPDAEVLGITDHCEMRGQTLAVAGVRLARYVKVRKMFRDMMDRSDYESEVYDRDSRGADYVTFLIR